MNKYQEALDGLEYLLNEYYEPEDLKDLKILQELVDKQEKYKWHDLIKNPDDLPKEDYVEVLAKLELVSPQFGLERYRGSISYGVVEWCYDEWKVDYAFNVLAWKEIERFE